VKRILIITPDPEAGRTLELAFDLAGWGVSHVGTVRGTHPSGAGVVLLDMVDGTDEFRKVGKQSFKGAKVVAIAPRGEGEDSIMKSVPRTDAVVRRPYELTHLVRTVEGLVSK